MPSDPMTMSPVGVDCDVVGKASLRAFATVSNTEPWDAVA